MTDRQPSEVTNLDRYGDPVLPWSRVHDLLASGPKGPLVGFFLGTVRPDGRPHAAQIGAVWPMATPADPEPARHGTWRTTRPA